MNNLNELIALTQLYLLREFDPQDKLLTAPKIMKEFIPHAVNFATFEGHQSGPALTDQKEANIIEYAPLFDTLKMGHSETLKSSKIDYVGYKSLPIQVVKQEPPKKNIEPKKNDSSFVLEPFNQSSSYDFSEIKRLFPQQAIRENVPSDQQAKLLKNGQQTFPIILLSFNEDPKHVAFLNNLAFAITRTFLPAKVLLANTIEQEKNWEAILHSPNLRLVIASDYGIYQLPELLKYFKENAQTNKHFIHNTPLLLLSDLNLYLKEPKLKPLLWRALCAEFIK